MGKLKALFKSTNSSSGVDQSKKKKGKKTVEVEEPTSMMVEPVSTEEVVPSRPETIEVDSPDSRGEGVGEQQPLAIAEPSIMEEVRVPPAEGGPVGQALGVAPSEPGADKRDESAIAGSSLPKSDLRIRLEGLGIDIPFPDRVAEVGALRWRETRRQIVGDLDMGYKGGREPVRGNKFVPEHSLHEEDSVFSAGWAQIAASEQFALPKDKKLLTGLPTAGLRYALLSYHTRGALIGEEMFDRLTTLYDAVEKLSTQLVGERSDRTDLEKRAAALEAEREGVDAKWRGELATKQSTIATLQTKCATQSDLILRLREEVFQLKRKNEGAEREVAEWRDQTLGLEKEYKADQAKWESVVSQLQSELGETKSSYEKALANITSLEAQLKHLSSEDGKMEVIKEFREGTYGKVEVSLAVKAGFDYLRARIPSEVSSTSTFPYPPRVQRVLTYLEELEEDGAGVDLGDDEEGDDDDDDHESDDNGDGDEGDDEDDGKKDGNGDGGEGA